jgi:iron complex outermembrane recepter protein
MRHHPIRLLLGSAAVLGGLGSGSVATAQTSPSAVDLDEVVVTGSRLAGGNRVAPVEVISRDDLSLLGGDLSVLVGRITANSGSEARVDQLNQPQTSGTAQFNLRNLGLGSTLVLVDGLRWTTSAVVATDGTGFVDINSLVPPIALQRVEVLKDGASALYGSDAVAGVVNMVTRRGVTAPELSVGHAFGRGFGETTVQGLTGLRLAGADVTLAASHFHRSALGSDERGFTQAGRYDRAAWTAVTSYGQPGSYFRPGTGGFAPDPDCDAPLFASAFRNGPADPFCRLDYSDFFDLAPEETRTQVFIDARRDLGRATVWLQAAGSDTFTRARQSPSLPILARSLTVPARHPDNPFGETVQFRGRLLGAESGASFADFDYRTGRLAGGVSGEIAGWSAAVSATASRQHVDYDKPDVIGSALQNALNGLGGAGCDPATGAPGSGACVYFNPFGSAALGTGTANSDALIASLTGSTGLKGASSLSTIDVQADRRLVETTEASVDLAVGGQLRDSRFRQDWSDEANAGDLLTAGFSPDIEGRQRAWAAFAEIRARLGARLDAQLAVRHEAEAGQAALSPRIATRWQATSALALRASWGRAFRAPSVFVTQGAQASQPSVFDRGAFVFVNVLTSGAPDLRPERSESLNLGAVWTPLEGLSLTLDGWRFDYEDLVVKESAQAILDQAARDTTAGLTGTDAQSRLTRDGSGALTFLSLNFINASAVTTQGLDATARYARPLAGGLLSTTAAWTWVDRYDIRLTPGAPELPAVGSTNLGNLARSMPRSRVEGALAWTGARDRVGLSIHYTHGYRNDRSGITRTDIASQTTFDLSYERRLGPGLDLRLGAINLTDRDPPLAQFALGYDPGVADPRGRMISVEVARSF